MPKYLGYNKFTTENFERNRGVKEGIKKCKGVKQSIHGGNSKTGDGKERTGMF